MEKKIFNDTKRAFQLKSDKDIGRSLFIFRMIAKPTLVSMGIWVTKFALKLHLPVEDFVRETIFSQFVGGETMEECLPTIHKIYEKNVKTVLDYASEKKRSNKGADFDRNMDDILEIADFAYDHKEVPFVIIKPSALGRFWVWEKVNAGKELTDGEQKSWNNIKIRLDKLCQKIFELGLRISVDAEESWIQDAADELVEKMMEKYNKERVVVFGTIQCYRWDRLQYIKDVYKRGKENNFKIGKKIVRGAYLEKENRRAEKMGYLTPICEDKEATDVNFNTIMMYIFTHLDDISLYVGTHNEVSTYQAMHIMNQKGIESNDGRVWFSQLYGMSDHITYNLAAEGYNSAKFMPFGRVQEVIPYLIRRAEENSSVEAQSGRELALLEEEKRRRKGTYRKRIW